MRRAILVGILLLLPVLGHAQDAGDGDDADSSSPEQPSSVHSKASGTRKAVKSEKETDGTSAPNRFEADTVIKSQYKHEGEQLEVDPD